MSLTLRFYAEELERRRNHLDLELLIGCSFMKVCEYSFYTLMGTLATWTLGGNVMPWLILGTNLLGSVLVAGPVVVMTAMTYQLFRPPRQQDEQNFSLSVMTIDFCGALITAAISYALFEMSAIPLLAGTLLASALEFVCDKFALC